MPRAPFHLVNLEDDTAPGDASQVAAPVGKQTETVVQLTSAQDQRQEEEA